MAEAILHLVNLTDETPHKRLARAADVPPQHREILDDLVDARLVVINEVNDQQVYAPAHESLFSAWPPLAELIERRRDDLVLRGRLERRAADWREGGGTQSGLLSGLELVQARDWRQRNRDLATSDVAAYVDASTARQRRGRMIRTGVAAVVAALAVALVVVLLVNARADRRRAEAARVGELAAIAQRELVHDPAAAAAALLRGLEIDPGAGELPAAVPQPAPLPRPRRLSRTGPGDVLPARRGRWRRRGDDGRPDPGLGHRPRDGPHLPAVRCPGGPAGRPGLRRCRRRRRPERLRPGFGRATTRTALTVFSANDQSVPLLAFSHDGSLLAEGRRSWVALWDMRDPSSPQRLGAWRSNVGDPTAVAVLDDGRVLVASATTRLAVWNALGDGSSATLVAGRTDTGVQHLSVAADGSTVLVDYPSFDSVALVDIGTGTTIGTFSATDPSAPPSTLPPVSWTSSLSSDGGTVASFDLAGRGYAFDTADGHLITGLTGGHTSLVSDSFFNDAGLLFTASVDGSLRLWNPRASETEVSGDLSDDLCREFGGRIDADSWELAFADDAFDVPCQATEAPEPAALKVSSSADVGSVPEVSTPSTVVFQDTFEGATSFRTGEQQLSTGTVTTSIKGGRYRMEVEGVGAGYTAWQSTPTSGAGDTWAVSTTQGRAAASAASTSPTAPPRSPSPWTATRAAGRWRGSARSATPTTSRSRSRSEPQASCPWSTTAACWRCSSAADGSRPWRPGLRPPTGVGVATHGDAASCDFDDITLTTAP